MALQYICWGATCQPPVCVIPVGYSWTIEGDAYPVIEKQADDGFEFDAYEYADTECEESDAIEESDDNLWILCNAPLFAWSRQHRHSSLNCRQSFLYIVIQQLCLMRTNWGDYTLCNSWCSIAQCTSRQQHATASHENFLDWPSLTYR